MEGSGEDETESLMKRGIRSEYPFSCLKTVNTGSFTPLVTFPENPRQNDQKISEAQKAPPLIDLFGSGFSGLGLITTDYAQQNSLYFLAEISSWNFTGPRYLVPSFPVNSPLTGDFLL
uniref:Uncharacterized protein n=1 Tax=Candidatus Kentrum sp. MB TaxID=2138164 RepID=A0A451BAP9_9GAMM|nr:MAG: hypothetical protein BECKMB1821G_GA0114241_100858 [Candidatus Kentron sp. MB]VFK30721.1 MAG: hypothetical protein BECKMB1821I_GA0114274_101733 [Candidatus Kentron sp. MB]VFK75334.1 MAG: hypothetical protein BECKMB1821H_GA0114242_10209 [Candidatus Kentron sp. MB]